MTAAADTFQAYSSSFFSSLPSVRAAGADFKAAGGLGPSLQADIALIIAKHPEVASRYGLQLLHRHSDIDDDEVMLAHYNTTIPVKRREISDVALGHIRPAIWGLAPGTNVFVPLEYAFTEDEEELSTQLDPAFAKDFSALLRAHNLERILGLAFIRKDITMGVETTFDRANVIMPADVYAEVKNAIQVLWQLALMPSGSADQPHSLAVYCRQVCFVRGSDGEHFFLGHNRGGSTCIRLSYCLEIPGC
ncbi:hypothetical protein V8E36_002230 [Tilletia maclaganii]